MFVLEDFHQTRSFEHIHSLISAYFAISHLSFVLTHTVDLDVLLYFNFNSHLYTNVHPKTRKGVLVNIYTTDPNSPTQRGRGSRTLWLP